MKSTHTLVTLIIAAILSVLFGVGFMYMVTPNEKQAKLYDQQREADFVKISTAIQGYRDAKNELPKTLKTLSEAKLDAESSTGVSALDSLLSSFASLTVRDPQTNKYYGYSFENQQGEKYKLCADFATDTNGKADEEISTGSSNRYTKATTTVKHSKGKNVCVEYTAKDKSKAASKTYSSDGNSYSTNNGSSNSNSAAARDEQRKTGILVIGLDLQKYYEKNGYYPAELSDLVSAKITTRMPTDPKTGASYTYTVLEVKDGKPARVKVSGVLEDKSDPDADDASGTISIIAPS